MPPGLLKKIEDRGRRADLSYVSLGPDGQWYMREQDGSTWWGGQTNGCYDSISPMKVRVTHMDLACDDTYWIRYK